MTQIMRCLNRSVAIINATLQLLDIYRFAHPLQSKKIPNRWIAGNCSQLQEEKGRDRPGGNKAIQTCKRPMIRLNGISY